MVYPTCLLNRRLAKAGPSVRIGYPPPFNAKNTMSEVLNKVIVLSLNAAWQPIKTITVRKAIENMTSNPYGEPPEYGLDIEFGTNADGSINYDELVSARAVKWSEWVTLPVRPCDLFIQCKNGQRIRVPTVTVCSRFKDTLRKEPKLSKRAILDRDGLVDQYTGEKLSKHEANVDHVIPRDKGGKDRWENLVTTRRKTNSLKGNRFNHEVGLKLIRQPKKPKAVPVAATIKEIKHPSWAKFLLN